MTARLGLILLLLLASCGDLPQPFLGNPGSTGRMLARPPTPRLAVPPPGNALLADAPSHALAEALAAGLQRYEVPAVADAIQRGDWSLAVRAEQRGETVVPSYTVLNPKGEEQGSADGPAVSTAAWADATPATLQQAAKDAAPKIAGLLTSIQTAISHADPNSLYNRPAKVQVMTVTGAPGDGNASLTRQMKTRLAALGPMVQDSATGADFTVQGQVKVVPIPGAQQRVEIQWYVKNAAGDERGRVVQLNDIPAGTLDRYWGDVAMIVASEASGGVNDVILRQSGREPGREPGGEAAAPAEQPRGQGKGALLEGRQSGGVERPVPLIPLHGPEK